VVIEFLLLVAIMMLPMITGGYTFYKSYKLIKDAETNGK